LGEFDVLIFNKLNVKKGCLLQTFMLKRFFLATYFTGGRSKSPFSMKLNPWFLVKDNEGF